LGRQQKIAGRFSQAQVAGEYGHNHGLNAAPVEGIGLNN